MSNNTFSLLFYALKMVKHEDMEHLNIISFVYKAINKLNSASFRNHFTPDSFVHEYGTRPVSRDDL